MKNEPLRVISLYQPWASLMAAGAKSNETRGWSTTYRGDIAIHAGKTCDHLMCMDDYVRAALGPDAKQPVILPAGAVLCVVELYGVVSTSYIVGLADEERHFGDYSHGRFVWLTRNLRVLKEPVRTRGYQKIWTLDPAVERLVREQLV